MSLVKGIADGILAGLGMVRPRRADAVDAVRVRARAALRGRKPRAKKEVAPCAVHTSAIPADTEDPGNGDPGNPSASAPSDPPLVDGSDEFWARVSRGADSAYVSRLVERGLLTPPTDIEPEDDEP